MGRRRLVFDAFNFAIITALVLVAIFRPNEEVLLARMIPAVFTFVLLLVLGGLWSTWVHRRGSRTLGELIFALPSLKVQPKDHSLWRSHWGWQLILSLATVLIFGSYQTGVSLMELLDRDGLTAAINLFHQLANPNWQLLPQAILKIIETIFIALMATVFAVPLAFVLCFFSARNLMQGPKAVAVYACLRTAFNVIRSVEPIIWAIVFSVWVGIGPFAGMLALMVQSVASLTKQYSELVEAVDQGPIDAIRATGANRIQTVWFGIVPQVTLPFVSFTIYRWDINVRMATIIGFAGGGGIGTLLNQYSMRSLWPEVGCLILVIAAVVWAMDVASAYIREALK